MTAEPLLGDPELDRLVGDAELQARAAESDEPDWVREPDGDELPANGAAVIGPSLVFESIGDVLDRVDSSPPPCFLARPVWPADAYGVVGASMKAGKTWLDLDLAVATAARTAWLGHFPIERSGPVLLFLGEGGPRKMMRRMRAVAAFHNVKLRDLPIRLCFRSPHLTRAEHLEAMRAEIEANRPVLVVLDPLYLAARGANASQLNEMGVHLEAIQTLCQRVGAALVVIHHFNRQEGRGLARLSGAGPAEWGRVIVTAEVKSTRTDTETGESVVTLELAFAGDEIPETTFRIRRRVRAEDKDDLSSPLTYSVEILEGDQVPDDDEAGLRPAARRVLAVLNAAAPEWLGTHEIGDRLAVDESGQSPLKVRTIQDSTKALVDRELVETRRDVAGNAYQWRMRLDDEPEEAENAY